jgi:hypothetical protein
MARGRVSLAVEMLGIVHVNSRPRARPAVLRCWSTRLQQDDQQDDDQNDDEQSATDIHLSYLLLRQEPARGASSGAVARFTAG